MTLNNCILTSIIKIGNGFLILESFPTLLCSQSPPSAWAPCNLPSAQEEDLTSLSCGSLRRAAPNMAVDFIRVSALERPEKVQVRHFIGGESPII